MYGISEEKFKKVEAIVSKLGGNREKDVLNRCDKIEAETINEEHEVYEILAVADTDGHRDGFSVDLVTGKICG